MQLRDWSDDLATDLFDLCDGEKDDGREEEEDGPSSRETGLYLCLTVMVHKPNSNKLEVYMEFQFRGFKLNIGDFKKSRAALWVVCGLWAVVCAPPAL